MNPSFPQVLVDRYLVRSELGRGATGSVYRAHDSLLGREVAIKLLHTRDLNDPHALSRFQREGEILAGLDHPGIVRVLDAGAWQGSPYLVFELVEGGRTLRQAFLGRPLRERMALVRDLARALGHAHARGVTHRDIKPDNVLVDREGRVRVSDFGLASAIGLSRLTASGTALGTPVAMAPEQVQGDHGAWGPPTDVWALGVVLYEALTGELPFFAETMIQLGALILETEPRPPRSFGPVPEELEALCARCLRKDPADRPAQAGVVADELEAWLQREREAPAAAAPRRGHALPLALVGAWALTALLAVWGWSRGAGPETAAAAPPAVTPPPRDPELARRLQRARARLERGDPTGALADLDEALRRAPGELEALLLRARVRAARGDEAGARSDAQAALALEPSRAPAYHVLGTLALRAGDWAGAVEHLSRAIERDPEDPLLWTDRAAAWLEQRQPDRALADVVRALELDPRHLGAQLCRGVILVEARRLDEAEAGLTRVLEAFPDHPEALRWLGRVHHARGDWTRAIEAYERAIPLLPPQDPRLRAVREWRDRARAGLEPSGR